MKAEQNITRKLEIGFTGEHVLSPLAATPHAASCCFLNMLSPTAERMQSARMC